MILEIVIALVLFWLALAVLGLLVEIVMDSPRLLCVVLGGVVCGIVFVVVGGIYLLWS